METLLLYLLLGAFAGVLAGLFGVGGGLVIVPVLVFIFQSQEVSGSLIMHLAIGTSLATIVVTSLSSVRAHHRREAVLWPIVGRLTPGIIAGALLGAALADFIPSDSLRLLFGVFELLVAVQLGLAARVAPRRPLPGWPGTSLAGVLIGSVSSAIGIGGGTLIVPFLAWCSVSLRHAVAAAAAGGLPLALAGSVGFMMTGWHEAQLPAWSSGYVYWPAFAAIATASVLFAPLGARLAHALPVMVLQRTFALFLAALGVRMLVWG